jgi:hypothetical protein
MSVTLGCPRVSSGRVEANVGRDLRDRKKMAAFTYHSNQCAVLLSSMETRSAGHALIRPRCQGMAGHVWLTQFEPRFCTGQGGC